MALANRFSRLPRDVSLSSKAVRAAAVQPLPRVVCCPLPISHGRRAHGAKPIEFLSEDLVRTMALKCHRRRWIHGVLSRLSLLRRDRLLDGVHMCLFPNVDLVLCCARLRWNSSLVSAAR